MWPGNALISPDGPLRRRGRVRAPTAEVPLSRHPFPAPHNSGREWNSDVPHRRRVYEYPSGNNNPWNQDNETTWLDWHRLEKHRVIYRFFKGMIAFRKAHPSLARSCFWRDDVCTYGVDRQVDLSYCSNSLAFCLHGGSQQDLNIYVMINACWEDLNFRIQEGEARDWMRIADTSKPSSARSAGNWQRGAPCLAGLQGSKPDPSWCSCEAPEQGRLNSNWKKEYPPVPFPYKRILCPVDFDEYSGEALREAAALALNGVGTVHVLHALQINPLVDQGAAEGFAAGELYEAQIEFARKQVEQMLATMPPGVQREIIIEIGEPGNCIIDAATKAGADLVVMATHGRKGLKHLVLGSVAERVVRESPVPVLALRPASRNRSE